MIDAPLLFPHPSFMRIRNLGGHYYASFLAAGYREWHSPAGSTPYLLQKALYDAGGARCFFVNVFVYDLSDFRPEIPLGFQPEADYNTHSRGVKEHPTFRVTLWPDNMTPDDIEAFFWRVYRTMEARPYGD